jgi:hypothetical protein
MKEKEVEDVIGGEEQWENADRTDGERVEAKNWGPPVCSC